MLHVNSKGYTFDDKNGGKDPVEELKMLLAAEVTSLNSFEHCLKTPSAASLHSVSASCLALHSVNVRLLTERLAELGVEAQKSSDLWHSFLELLGSTAVVFGEEAILAALRKHETALLTEYQNKIQSFDGQDLLLVQGTLIPNQVKVLELLGGIRTEAPALTVNPVAWA